MSNRILSALMPIKRAFNTSAIRKAHTGADPYDQSAVKQWKMLSYLVAIPSVVIFSVYAYLLEKEHEAHFVRPEFIPYEHLRIRNKRFPWGDGNKSFFHNPKYNALPDGYEELDE